jgi:hypothetical protein
MASGIVVGGECGSLLHSDNTRPDIRTSSSRQSRVGTCVGEQDASSLSKSNHADRGARANEPPEPKARQGKASHRPPPSLSHLRPSATTCLVSMQHAALLALHSFDTHKYSTISPISPDTLHSLSLPQQPACHRDEIPPAHSAGGYDRLLNPA